MEARTSKELGIELKRLREEKGLTQEELADISTLGTDEIEGLENGEDTASSVSLLKVFCALKIDNPDKILYK